MIRSMTGFGRAECNENGTKVTAEVHSVNGRFLDLKFKLPRCLYEYENELRKISQQYIERGRVFLTVNIDCPDALTGNFKVDFNLAERYVRLAEEMAERFGINNPIDAQALLNMPEVVKIEENNADAGIIWEIAKNAVISALEVHKTMREKEGTAIGTDVSGRLDTIMGYIDEIEKKAPEIVETNTVRLRSRIEKIIESDKIDENRFTLEVALYAERVDITEECVRYKSHSKVFASEISSEKTSGKKLSFLLQEMNREVNTIASKANDAGISQLAVLIKGEQEKMREQVENME